MIEPSLLATLTGLKLCIIHPDHQSARVLVASMAQLGCEATHCWPLPARAPQDVELVVLCIEPHNPHRLATLMSELAAAQVPVIALADYQNAALFPLLIELKPAAILDKMINPFALIVQIIGTLGLARECQALRQKIEHSRQSDKQKLTQAKGILMRKHGIDENTAYRFMRREAMNSRSSLDSTAERVISRRGYQACD